MSRVKLHLLLLVVILQGCTLPTFYQRFYTFNKTVSDGNLAQAEEMLEANSEKLAKGKLQFL